METIVICFCDLEGGRIVWWYNNYINYNREQN